MTDNDTDNDTGAALSDVEVREEALARVRDALAPLQEVPAVGLDAEKHETLRELSDSLSSLESELTNEVSQMRDAEADDE